MSTCPDRRSTRQRTLVAGSIAGIFVLTGAGNAAGAAMPLDRAAPAASSSADAVSAPFALKFQDDFNGTEVNKKAWSVFNGPGNGRTGPKSKTNTFLRNGHLVLRARKINGVWYGAGVSNARAVVQTYGKYEMRVRFDAGKGIRTAGLIWPKDGWPPEVDFYEIDDTLRTINRLTNHHKPGNKMIHASYKADFTQWHIVGLEWTPGALRFTLDGVVKVTMTSNVPRQPMWFGQNVALKPDGKGPDSTTPAEVAVEMDWIKIYRYTG